MFQKAGIILCLFIQFCAFIVSAAVQYCQEPICGNASNTYLRVKGGPSGRVQGHSTAALNLIDKIDGSKSEQKSIASSTPISISKDDFLEISSPRNTWLFFENKSASFSMDIGTANMVSYQTWSLPSNLFTYFPYAYYDDFIPLEEVPEDLKFADANRVMKSYYLDSGENPIDIYTHFKITDDEINEIGTSYFYSIDGDEEGFDSDDYKFSDVPLNLGDADTGTAAGVNFNNRLHLVNYVNTKTVDAFGSISTPLGDFECLRISLSTIKNSRTDTSSAFTFEESFNSVAFVTKEGLNFVARTSSTSGSANLSQMQMKFFVPTGTLGQTPMVQVNNDGDGVGINKTSTTAHESAILDIGDDSLGILIPRVLEAKRPANAAEGLLIYQTDNNPGFYYYDGTTWTRLNNTTPAPSSAQVALSSKQVNARVNKRGLSQLVNGTVFIPLSSTQGMSPDDFLIHLQAEGETNGLYISKKGANGFEVKEQNNGTSNVKFSWSLNQI